MCDIPNVSLEALWHLYHTMESDLFESSGIRGRFVADSHQFETCLAFLGIKGDDEDDDTDANPSEGDD